MTDAIIAVKERPLLTRHGRQVGTYTLRRIAPEWDGHTLYLVEVDANGIQFFAGPTNASRYAGRTIGALTGVRSGWAVTAYEDRSKFRAGRQGWYAPVDVKNQTHGVRILLTYYMLLHYPDQDVRNLNQLTAKACKLI